MFCYQKLAPAPTRPGEVFTLVNLKKNREDNSNSETKEFLEEDIMIDSIDYYYSNVIARASKTMSECRNNKINLQKTGTDN